MFFKDIRTSLFLMDPFRKLFDNDKPLTFSLELHSSGKKIISTPLIYANWIELLSTGGVSDLDEGAACPSIFRDVSVPISTLMRAHQSYLKRQHTHARLLLVL